MKPIVLEPCYRCGDTETYHGADAIFHCRKCDRPICSSPNCLYEDGDDTGSYPVCEGGCEE